MGWAWGQNPATPQPAARPPGRPVIGLGGACARPGEGGRVPSGRRVGGGGGLGGESGGRRELVRGRASRVPEIGEQAPRGAESGGRASGEGKPGGLRAAARCTARSQHRQPARPRSLPGGSGAGSGRGARSGSLTCRRPAAPPAGRAQAGRAEDRPPAPQPSRRGEPRSPRGAPAPWRPGSGSRSTVFRKTR